MPPREHQRAPQAAVAPFLRLALAAADNLDVIRAPSAAEWTL
jgi:hypothetical protein